MRNPRSPDKTALGVTATLVVVTVSNPIRNRVATRDVILQDATATDQLKPKKRPMVWITYHLR